MRSLRLCLSPPLLSAGLVLALSAGARAELIVDNARFDTPTPHFSTTTLTGPHHAGPSAAEGWKTWNSSAATTTTSLLHCTLPGAGSNMIHVTTTGKGDGIAQILDPHHTGAAGAGVSAYVYVLSGRVCLVSGSHKHLGLDAVSSTTNSWQLLSGANGRAPTDALALCSYKGPADFYVAQVGGDPSVGTASTAPEPSSLLSCAVGALFSALGLARRRKCGRESAMLFRGARL
jgi:hypothetical protein